MCECERRKRTPIYRSCEVGGFVSVFVCIWFCGFDFCVFGGCGFKGVFACLFVFVFGCSCVRVCLFVVVCVCVCVSVPF